MLDHEEKQGDITDTDLKIQEYTGIVQDLNSKVQATPTELIDIANLRKDLQDKRNQLVSLTDRNKELAGKIESSTEVVETINQYIDDCDVESYNRRIQNSNDLGTLIQKIESKLSELLGEKKRNERQASALDGIPCGSTYPTCKFIKDAYVAKANIPANETDIEILEGKK